MAVSNLDMSLPRTQDAPPPYPRQRIINDDTSGGRLLAVGSPCLPRPTPPRGHASSTLYNCMHTVCAVFFFPFFSLSLRKKFGRDANALLQYLSRWSPPVNLHDRTATLPLLTPPHTARLLRLRPLAASFTHTCKIATSPPPDPQHSLPPLSRGLPVGAPAPNWASSEFAGDKHPPGMPAPLSSSCSAKWSVPTLKQFIYGSDPNYTSKYMYYTC